MDKVERASLLVAYQRYLAAFNANDLDAINDCISYPLAYIGGDSVTMLDQFPISPADMKASKGWGTNLRISPTIIPQTTEVLSQVSKGIRLGALGLMEFLG